MVATTTGIATVVTVTARSVSSLRLKQRFNEDFVPFFAIGSLYHMLTRRYSHAIFPLLVPLPPSAHRVVARAV